MPRDLGTLNPGEEFLFQVRPVARALIPYFIITMILAGTIIFLPLAMLMGVALILLYLVSFRTVRYIITTDRIIMLRKLVSGDRRDIYFSAILDFNVSQALGGRIFYYGTIQPVLNDSETSSGAALDPDDSLGALESLSHIGNPNILLHTLQNLAQSKQARKKSFE